jgi:hypothetical protein
METNNKEELSFLKITCTGPNNCELEIEGSPKELAKAVATLITDSSEETADFRDIFRLALMLAKFKNDSEEESV